MQITTAVVNNAELIRDKQKQIDIYYETEVWKWGSKDEESLRYKT